MEFLKQFYWIRRLWFLFRVRGISSMWSAYWYVTEFKRFSAYLKDTCRIVDLRPFKMAYWHHGCNFFSANIVQDLTYTKVFVKMGGVMNLALRESIAIDLVRPYLSDKFCVPLVVASNEDDNYNFIATSFIESQPLYADIVLFESEKSVISADDFIAVILKQMLDIIDALYSAQIVHRDVRPDNLLLSCDPITGFPRLTIIDFALSVSSNMDLPPLILKEPHEAFFAGLGEIWKPDTYVWDDAFSFYLIAKSFATNSRCDEVKFLLTSISSNIGQLEHSGFSGMLVSKTY